MFEYLNGKLIENKLTYVVIDVQGIGYKLLIAPNTISFPLGSMCTLFTSFVVRENAQLLYGFSDQASRDLFESLISISGVGPKTALCILSQFSAHSFSEAILAGNITRISSVPGLGKKTAEKMVLDLRDKLLKKPIHNTAQHPKENLLHHDAILALTNLGYSERLASKAIEKVLKKHDKQLELPELIAEALRVQ